MTDEDDTATIESGSGLVIRSVKTQGGRSARGTVQEGGSGASSGGARPAESAPRAEASAESVDRAQKLQAEKAKLLQRLQEIERQEAELGVTRRR